MKNKEEIICRCEEVTRDEIMEAINDGRTTVSGIKKHTRAGMGACQGRTCGKMIMKILIEKGLQNSETILADTPRTPLVPIKIAEIGEPGNE